MTFQLPDDVISILQRLKKSGFDGFVVGGAVRDLLQEKEVHDWDFATDAMPEQIQKVFPGSFYDNQFGTVGIPRDGNIFEVTTFRTEHGYSDKRRPNKVEWGKSLEEDLSRRDFTINAMALNSKLKIQNSKLKTEGEKNLVEIEVEIIDPFGGQKDLKNKLIRAVGGPTERFSEDALRMMRAIRLGAELGFGIEKKTLEAIKKNKDLIKEISWERIRDEFLKIISSNFPADGVKLLYSTGLLEIILPELVKGAGVPQGGHHINDVFTHCVESLRFCPSLDVWIRLATLLHDVGKPDTMVIRDGKPTFYNHEVVGARIVKVIANRLRLPRKKRDFLWKMVRWHMFAYNPEMTDSAIRRFMRRVGKEDIPKMIELRVGDRKGGGSRETSWRLEELKSRIAGLMNDPLTVADLKIDGFDVMKTLNIKPGPTIGKVLNFLFEEVLEDPSKNDREYLLSRIPAAVNSKDSQQSSD
ncbi:CCA tRNA nucleotidyltransferase [Candidatus Collierbacteria bacterium]|nr:CCA tRNA nucleotidyltransferase [Candidatus Collierbacteria bacterium]